MNYTAYFDGACWPYNPGGDMGIGSLIIKDGEEIFTHTDYVPKHKDNSNNVAEYMAFISIIQEAATGGIKGNLQIFGDSQLVVKQMNREWGINSGRYADYARTALQLLDEAEKHCNVTITWIPREKNERADELSTLIMREKGIREFVKPKKTSFSKFSRRF